MGSRGPAPQLDALRRERPSDQATWTHLPAAGREGDAPAWPLPRPTKRERTIWAQVWRLPQAIMWERHGQAYEVAIHVRTSIQAERPGASASMLGRYQQQRTALGLSEDGLLRRRWIIDGESVIAPNPTTHRPRRAAVSKDRFLDVIDGGSG